MATTTYVETDSKHDTVIVDGKKVKKDKHGKKDKHNKHGKKDKHDAVYVDGKKVKKDKHGRRRNKLADKTDNHNYATTTVVPPGAHVAQVEVIGKHHNPNVVADVATTTPGVVTDIDVHQSKHNNGRDIDINITIPKPRVEVVKPVHKHHDHHYDDHHHHNHPHKPAEVIEVREVLIPTSNITTTSCSNCSCGNRQGQTNYTQGQDFVTNTRSVEYSTTSYPANSNMGQGQSTQSGDFNNSYQNKCSCGSGQSVNSNYSTGSTTSQANYSMGSTTSQANYNQGQDYTSGGTRTIVHEHVHPIENVVVQEFVHPSQREVIVENVHQVRTTEMHDHLRPYVTEEIRQDVYLPEVVSVEHRHVDAGVVGRDVRHVDVPHKEHHDHHDHHDHHKTKHNVPLIKPHGPPTVVDVNISLNPTSKH